MPPCFVNSEKSFFTNITRFHISYSKKRTSNDSLFNILHHRRCLRHVKRAFYRALFEIEFPRQDFVYEYCSLQLSVRFGQKCAAEHFLLDIVGGKLEAYYQALMSLEPASPLRREYSFLQRVFRWHREDR